MIPYYSYARSDKKDAPRISITGRLMADLLVTAGANRVLTMTCTSRRSTVFSASPPTTSTRRRCCCDYFRQFDLRNTVAVAADAGHVKEAANYAERLRLPLAFVDKRRISDVEVEAQAVVGDVDGKNAIIFDDEIAAGTSLIGHREVLQEHGRARTMRCRLHARRAVRRAVAKIAALAAEGSRRHEHRARAPRKADREDHASSPSPRSSAKPSSASTPGSPSARCSCRLKLEAGVAEGDLIALANRFLGINAPEGCLVGSPHVGSIAGVQVFDEPLACLAPPDFRVVAGDVVRLRQCGQVDVDRTALHVEPANDGALSQRERLPGGSPAAPHQELSAEPRRPGSGGASISNEKGGAGGASASCPDSKAAGATAAPAARRRRPRLAAPSRSPGRRRLAPTLANDTLGTQPSSPPPASLLIAETVCAAAMFRRRTSALLASR